MSAIADFRIIETSKLNDLKANAEIKIQKGFLSKKTIDTYWDYLNLNSKKLKDFPYSGYVFAELLIFLVESKGIDLLKSEHDDVVNSIVNKRQNSTVILTYGHRRSFLTKLIAEEFSVEELIAFNKDFSGNDDPEWARAEIEGIRALHDSLGQLSGDDQVVLLSIG